MNMQLIFLFLLLFLPVSYSNDVFSSSSRIKAMLAAEAVYLDGLKKFLQDAHRDINEDNDTTAANEEGNQIEHRGDEEEKNEDEWVTEDADVDDVNFQKLDDIERFYKEAVERQQRLWGTAQEIVNFVAHPTNAYFAIRHANSWYQLRHKVTGSLREGLLSYLPDLFAPGPGDLEGAALGLVRLQMTYNLTVDQLFRGDVLSHQGMPLATRDALLVARVASANGHQGEAQDWLRLLLNQNDVTGAVKAKVLGQLGLISFMLGHKEKAAHYLEQGEAFDRHQTDVADLRLRLRSNSPPSLIEPEAKLYWENELGMFYYNQSQLCSRNYTVSKLLSVHRCRYKCTWAPYFRYKEEILSHVPYASIFHDVVTDWEAEEMTKIATAEGTARSGVIVNQTDGTRGFTTYRSSDTLFLNDDHSPLLTKLSLRVKAMTGLDTEQRYPNGIDSAEGFQFVNYGIGGHYSAHTDALIAVDTVPATAKSGDRLATFLVYLSDVEVGGRTIFTAVDISVPPNKGSALFWYTFDTADNHDLLTMHAGCPVAIGEKWVANKWIRHYGNTFRRPCLRNPRASQWKLEKQFHTTCV